MSESEFWIKRSVGISAIGTVLVVMSTGKGGQQHRWGEYFIFISGRYPKSDHSSFNIRTTTIPNNVISIDVEYLKFELQQQVNSYLSAYLFEFYEKTKCNICRQEIQLEEGGPSDIIGMWLRGKFHKQILQAKEETQSDDFRALLATVTDLQPFMPVS